MVEYKQMLRIKKKSQGNFAFIDSQNLNLGTQRTGWKVDWKKFRQYLAKEHDVTQAYMFIGYMTEYESLYEHLHEMGYLVVLRPTTEITEDTTVNNKIVEKKTVKGNVDTELVLYAMKEIRNYKQAIIVSGDGDFYSLIEYLIGRNKLANILVPNFKYSRLLKPFENKIIRLDQIKNKISYNDRTHRRSSNKTKKPKTNQNN